MRLRKALTTLVLVAIAASSVAGCQLGSGQRGGKGGRSLEAPVQAPHSYYVDVTTMGGLCNLAIQSPACPEDSKGWEGSSEDNRVNR